MQIYHLVLGDIFFATKIRKMNTIQQKPNFIINSTISSPKEIVLDLQAFEKLLNQHLQLKDYGTSIEQLVFTFMAVSDDTPIKWEEEKKYIEIAKLLTMSLKLPFNALVNAEEILVKEMMASLFLNSIAIYADLEIPDFDWQIFYVDVKTLFVKEKWLRPRFSLEKQFVLDFGIGGEDWTLIGKKMSHFYQIEKVLNRKIQLSDYGIGTHQLYCAFVTLPNSSIISYPILKEYLVAKKQVRIVVALDYEELLMTDEYTLFQSLSKYLLKIMLQVAELQIANFDWKRLYRHLRWTLIVEGWLDEPLTIQEKNSITGLPNSLIKRIENNVDAVRLGALKTYCEKLKIPYRELMPEMY